MKIFRNQEGQVLVMTVLCMGILIGALGMAVDVGVLLRARRNMQIAADSAAMAGASALFYGGDATSAANAAASNVDSGITSSMVTVTLPSSVGGMACSSCVQVQLYKPTPTIFMHTFSNLYGANNFGSVNVAAKSIAGAPGAGEACGYIMDPHASDALWLHGKGSIKAPGCGMYVNSDASDALCVTGNNNGKSNFAWVAMRGQQGSGKCGQNGGFSVYANSAAETPKWESLPDPGKQCKTASNPSGTITPTTPSGSLTGSITGPGAGNVACYAGSGGNPVTLSAASLGPGVYVFTTGVTVSGTVQVDSPGSGMPGGGATLAVSGGSFTADTNSNLQISAPTTGAYNGLALYQSASDTNAMLLTFGSSGSTFDGMIYAPSAAVDLHDQGGTGATVNFGFVVGQLYDNGNVDINFTNYSSAHPTTSPFRVITLIG